MYMCVDVCYCCKEDVYVVNHYNCAAALSVTSYCDL